MIMMVRVLKSMISPSKNTFAWKNYLIHTKSYSPLCL